MLALTPSAGCLGWEASSPPIDQALACDAAQDAFATLVVVHANGNAVGLTEVELAKVALQVLRTAVLKHALLAALEDTEEGFDCVGVNVGALADVLAARMGKSMLFCRRESGLEAADQAV